MVIQLAVRADEVMAGDDLVRYSSELGILVSRVYDAKREQGHFLISAGDRSSTAEWIRLQPHVLVSVFRNVPDA